MTDKLKELLEKAKHLVVSPEQKEEQRRSFAFLPGDHAPFGVRRQQDRLDAAEQFHLESPGALSRKCAA